MTEARRPKLGSIAASLAMTIGAIATTHGSALALGVNDECGRRPGYLVFIDRGGNMTPGHCAGVSGTNSNWHAFGWGNRADEFRNDGNSHHACVFEYTNFNREAFFPDYVFIRKGYWLVWYDEVESNAWTQSDDCY